MPLEDHETSDAKTMTGKVNTRSISSEKRQRMTELLRRTCNAFFNSHTSLQVMKRPKSGEIERKSEDKSVEMSIPENIGGARRALITVMCQENGIPSLFPVVQCFFRGSKGPTPKKKQSCST